MRRCRFSLHSATTARDFLLPRALLFHCSSLFLFFPLHPECLFASLYIRVFLAPSSLSPPLSPCILPPFVIFVAPDRPLIFPSSFSTLKPRGDSCTLFQSPRILFLSRSPPSLPLLLLAPPTPNGTGLASLRAQSIAIRAKRGATPRAIRK